MQEGFVSPSRSLNTAARIDNRRTIIIRRPDRPDDDRLFLFCRERQVALRAVQIRSLPQAARPPAASARSPAGAGSCPACRVGQQ